MYVGINNLASLRKVASKPAARTTGRTYTMKFWEHQIMAYTVELCMQPGNVKSNDAARNQVRVGEGQFAPSTYQGHRDWPVDTSRSTGLQKFESWTVGLPRNCTEGKQEQSPENTERQSRGRSTRWVSRNSENKTPHQRKSLVSWFIDKMVKEKVDNCLPCQAVTTSGVERLEPLRMIPYQTPHGKNSRWIF